MIKIRKELIKASTTKYKLNNVLETQKSICINELKLKFGISHVDLENYFIDPEIPHLISKKLAKRHTLIPIEKNKNKLTVAMADPLNILALDDIKIVTGLSVKPVFATSEDILNAIEQYYVTESVGLILEEFNQNYNAGDIKGTNEEILNKINNAPVVKLVNSIIAQAVKAKASDIHIEPFEEIINIRFRVDGELRKIIVLSKSAHPAIVTRIKIISKMNIAEKRLPQDGRVEINIDDKEIDLRISVLPTIHGEKIVIRLLYRNSLLLSKKQLGFTEENLNIFDKIIKSPNGIILVTGPTGSGKSTTLYAVLKELNQINKNIITIEDPVEYQMDNINQVQVNNKTGLTFAKGLRSILRQDPDIIMIGEIRDGETAQIAIRAAITGHLVLSTLHTNDTASTITRLIDMGIEPYLISSSLVGIIAQRLVRRICNNCKTSYIANTLEKQALQINNNIRTIIYKGEGCNFCNNTGYKGRIAIHEIMPVNREIRILIDKGSNIDSIREEANKQNIILLKENCIQLVKEGVTTLEELLRVTYNLDWEEKLFGK